MSREEAIANLNMISVAFVEPITKEQRKLIDDTFDMAIKALSQEPICDRDCEHCTWTECPIEPCDDAISRDAVLKLMDEYNAASVRQFGRPITGIASMRTDVRDLPSVTQKSGKWIDNGLYAKGHSHESFHCSMCGHNVIGFKEDLSKFCPNCGAKMERSDKE